MKIHKDCSSISIYSFYMLMKNNQLTYLIQEKETYSEKELKQYCEKNKEDLDVVLKSIYNEYQGLLFNKKELNKEKEHAMIILTQSTHRLATSILEIYKDTHSVDVLELLNDLDNFSFSKEEDIGKQIDVTIRKIKGLSDRSGIMTMNFNKKYLKNKKSVEEDYNEIVKTLDKQALSLESYLELGYNIDIKKTNVIRWINLMELAEAKNIENG